MIPSVVSYRMSSFGDTPDHGWVLGSVSSEHEEGALRPMAFQDFQEARCVLGMRSVVERQRCDRGLRPHTGERADNASPRSSAHAARTSSCPRQLEYRIPALG